MTWEETGRRFTVEIALFVPRLLTSVAILLGFWFVGLAVSRVLSRLTFARDIDPDLTALLARAARITLVAFGVVTALGTVGVDVKALVAGLGLTGFALGFALRDIIANTLAGILILAYKPFRRGDHIVVGGNEGTIAEIDLRYTILAGEGTVRVLIPNSTLFTNSITVSSAPPRAPPPP